MIALTLQTLASVTPDFQHFNFHVTIHLQNLINDTFFERKNRLHVRMN